MGGKSTETKQTNEPPAWAKPLLEKGAQAGMDLYNRGVGYNVYDGPTQGQFSAPSLQGMNSIMAATGGGGGAPITNESVFNTPQIQQARQAVQQIAAKREQAMQPMTGPANSGRPAWVDSYLKSNDLNKYRAAQDWIQANANIGPNAPEPTSQQLWESNKSRGR